MTLIWQNEAGAVSALGQGSFNSGSPTWPTVGYRRSERLRNCSEKQLLVYLCMPDITIRILKATETESGIIQMIINIYCVLFSVSNFPLG